MSWWRKVLTFRGKRLATPSQAIELELEEFDRRADESVSRARKAADEATKQIARAAQIPEHAVISESLRLSANIPPREGDLLQDLVHRARREKMIRMIKSRELKP